MANQRDFGRKAEEMKKVQKGAKEMTDPLKLLEMTEEEQAKFLFEKYAGSLWKSMVKISKEKFPDDPGVPSELSWYEREKEGLAFRLRDEVVRSEQGAERLNYGMWYVYRRVKYNDHRFDFEGKVSETEKALAASWFAYYAHPIDWIIAALKAKEKER